MKKLIFALLFFTSVGAFAGKTRLVNIPQLSCHGEFQTVQRAGGILYINGTPVPKGYEALFMKEGDGSWVVEIGWANHVTTLACE